MRATPRVSVIIPTRNRADLLDQALLALDAQQYEDFEVIVVDDGSDEDLGPVLEGRSVRGRPLRWFRQAGAGAVRARLRGVSESEAEILAFTDSDCEPQPGWLATAVGRIDQGADLVSGRTRPMRRVGPLERAVNEAKGGLFPSCNLAVRRDVYDAVGGFDVDAAQRWGFRVNGRARGLGFGEDTLLGWTVARSHRAVYDEEMLVLHRVFPPDGTEWFSRSVQMAAFPALVKEVPELRGPLIGPRGRFSHRSRTGFYVAVAALVTRRRSLVALAVAGWAGHRFHRTLLHAPVSYADRVRALPTQMGIDAVQGTALVVGSVRARTLVR